MTKIQTKKMIIEFNTSKGALKLSLGRELLSFNEHLTDDQFNKLKNWVKKNKLNTL